MDIIEYNQIGEQKNYWWFAEKNNLISMLLAKIGKNLNILDIGGGIGGEINSINKAGKVFLLDINTINLKHASTNLKVCADAQNIPFKNNTFDTITMFDVLEHLKKDGECVKQVRHVLKDKGYFIVMVPAFSFLFSGHDKVLGHMRRYNKADCIKLLEGLFSIQRVTYWNSILFVPISTIRVIKKFLKSAPALDIRKIPSIINTILSSILRLENFLINKGINLPIGLTLVLISRKK